jgi:hypothetical protein
MSEQRFIYDTSFGAGIPGLPHEVTEAQAQALGLEAELKAGIANGSYKPKQQAEPVKPKPAVKKEKE